MNILVSACLLGIACRYDGTDKAYKDIIALREKHNLIPVCPEELGGLTTPRKPSEIVANRVLDREGKDVTDAFELGAKKAFELAKEHGCTIAILKEKSPSCGHGKVYNGTFTGKLVPGHGKAAELLMNSGIQVIGETKAKEYFNTL